ncbi:MAG: hypothetical protein HY820_03185 [Acidobacteria bacterium]|nr:hypothetical protein [Acidobacteriota bacterium]
MSDKHDHKPNPKLDGPGKLLGGFAAGNLTDPEKQQLYQAALNDQELFDSLLEDEGLRQLLDEPGVRRELIDSLTPEQSLWQRIVHWFTTPVAWGAVGAVATAAVVLVVVANRNPRVPAAAEYAKVEQAAPHPAPAVTPPPPAATPAETQVATRSEDLRQRKREQVAAGPAEPAPKAPAPVVIGQVSKAAEERAQPAAAATAPPPQVVAADSARRDEAKKEEDVKKAEAAPVLLAFDYQVMPEGVQILPSEDGFAALVVRNTAANTTRVIASVRARKGFTETLRFPPNAAGQTFQVVLSRERPGQVIGDPGEFGLAAQSFRATPAVAMAKRKTADEAAPRPGSQAAGGRAAATPGQAGRATAASPAATTVSVDVTAPR